MCCPKCPVYYACPEMDSKGGCCNECDQKECKKFPSKVVSPTKEHQKGKEQFGREKRLNPCYSMTNVRN